jgi:hypothetical protein
MATHYRKNRKINLIQYYTQIIEYRQVQRTDEKIADYRDGHS